MFALDAENAALDLEGKLVGLAVGSPTAIVKGIEAAFLVAVEDLVAGDTRNAELTAEGAIFSPSSSRAMNLRRSSMVLHSFQGIRGLPKYPMCKPCVRYKLTAMCR